MEALIREIIRGVIRHCRSSPKDFDQMEENKAVRAIMSILEKGGFALLQVLYAILILIGLLFAGSAVVAKGIDIAFRLFVGLFLAGLGGGALYEFYRDERRK